MAIGDITLVDCKSHTHDAATLCKLYTKAQLEQMCLKRGLPAIGRRKSDLAARLATRHAARHTTRLEPATDSARNAIYIDLAR